MSLLWDDDEEDLTEIEYRRRPPRVVVHDEITHPMPTPTARVEDRAIPPSLDPTTHRPLGLRPAPPRDRFVAFIIDSYFGLFIYWLSGALLAGVFKTASLPELHANPGRLWIHLGITLAAFFFYYLLMESVFHATLGKLFTRLRVTEVSGLPPTLGNIFIRNFLRLVDYPLFFLIAVISMESSPLNQRLGDRAANTIVIKKARRPRPAVDLQHTPLASTLSRTLAEVLDMIFVSGLLYGLLLLVRPNHPLSTALIYLTLPLAYFSYYTLSEFLLETSPGKALFGRKVVMENGEPPDGTGATLRNLFRPLDYFLGYPLLVISKRKQRLGDMAADTFVVARGAGVKSLWGSLIVLFVVVLVFFLGVKNPQSLFRKHYGLNPLATLRSAFLSIPVGKTLKPNSKPGAPPVAKKPKADLPASTSQTLKLEEFYLATGPEPTQIRHDRSFKQGDLIFLFFKMEGFQTNDKAEAQLTEDLKVEDPEGNLLLDKPEIVKITKTVTDPTQAILFANNVQLPKNAAKGNYRVLITVNDLTTGKQFSFEKNFILQ
jgi:uncharacterized RDD family membrane protein YckC